MSEQKNNLPSVEVIHSEKFDILLSNDPAFSSDVDKLKDVVTDGIPLYWKPYNPSPIHGLFVDNAQSPNFIAKNRRVDLGYWRTEGIKATGDKKEFLVAKNSLLNEFGLAPKISKVLESEEGTEIARRYGFDSFSLVQPLVGVIERETGRKTMFYKFIPGHFILDSKMKEEDNLVHNALAGMRPKFTREVKDLLGENGVKTGDFDIDQLIASEDETGKHLYLIDIEGYRRKNIK